MQVERFQSSHETQGPSELALSKQILALMQPDDSRRQLDLLRCCSGNGVDVSLNSSKNANLDRRPIEELLEIKAQPNYHQFVQGLPKRSLNSNEQRSEASTLLTSNCDGKSETISMMLTDGTHLSIADDTFMTNVTLGPTGGRNKKLKQRAKLKKKMQKQVIYKDWNHFDHKLRAFTQVNGNQSAFYTTLLKIVGEEDHSVEPSAADLQVTGRSGGFVLQPLHDLNGIIGRPPVVPFLAQQAGPGL